MSEIRPLDRADLPSVANLLELVYRSGSRSAPVGLAAYVSRLFLDHPWFDRDIPSLVYVDEDDRIAGFLGSHVRRFTLDGRSTRVAVSGQLATEPAVRKRAAGALLLQRYLGGPQDLTLTDSASEPVRRMWEGLGGQALHLERMGWLRLFRPARFATEFAYRRTRAADSRVAASIRSMATPTDRVTGRLTRRWLTTEPPDVLVERLTPEAMCEHLAGVTKRLRFSPEYDVPFLAWLFGELARVESRGRLVGFLVRDHSQKVRGWYVYYLNPGGISEVLQIAGNEPDLPLVIDHLFHHARVNGAAALHGRMEPALVEALSVRRCVVHVGGYRVLIHSRDPDLRGAVLAGSGLLSRLDGDWWIRLRSGSFGA